MLVEKTEKVTFPGSQGVMLSGKIEHPGPLVKAWAIFAHCFTCSKDYLATSRITKELAQQGIGTLRFDFTGLGESEGQFHETTFSSNVDDLVCAAEWLKEQGKTPRLFIGHSLGGTAALVAATKVSCVKAVATLNSPYTPQHVKHHFSHVIEELYHCGTAEVEIAGRPFKMGRGFVDDLEAHDPQKLLKEFRGALLVCHTPTDTVVGIEQAAQLFQLARHPKSFVSLDRADHLLTGAVDCLYAARVISAWGYRYI